MIRAAAGMHMRRPSLASLASNASAELPWQPGIVRFYAAATSDGPTIPEIRIDDNLSLQKSPKNVESSGEKRPLVLLLSWLAAKQRHLSNFSRFYLDQGCDVLTIKIKPMQILLPKSGSQVLAKNVVQFLQHTEQQDKPLLVHTFSVGGYVYSEILQSMLDAEKEKEITSRIIGQIFDSPVDLDNIPIGMSKVLLKNQTMQTGLRKSLEMYQNLTFNIAGQHHLRCSRLFHHNPVKAPSIFFYSDADPITSPRAVERAIGMLKEVGHESVQGKEFKGSPHVSHMYKHREEYVSTLRLFLDQIDYFKKVSSEESSGTSSEKTESAV
ncbi:transmembrane protein 53-like isoform X2 [Amphiura filiformis]|uniref:transmembrane protein 53-like isoform X2 n=1 Tax=Amphiura filiformis TaxID=82378 RepID=UPI003B21B6E0